VLLFRPGRLLSMMGMLGLLAAACLLVPAPPRSVRAEDKGSGDLEHNRQLLERWRGDAEHWARLQHDLQAFAALSSEQQDRLRRLDHDLYQLEPAARKRLLHALQRYALWLDGLSAEDRARVLKTRDRPERLRVIRALREKQWIERLPRRTREELDRLPPKERATRMAELRRRERQLEKNWSHPKMGAADTHPARPTRLTDLAPAAQTYIRRQLLPKLTPAEMKQLHEAEGKADYVRVLRELAAKHKVTFPAAGRGSAVP
jgi:hypothetical protein